jgi:hypothetical protein
VSAGNNTFKAESDSNTFRMTRSWSNSDVVGDLHVLSYLVVFRPAGAPAPQVSGLTLKPGPNGVTASATVDGAPLSLTFKN